MDKRDFVWPSDQTRADNDELDRVCQYAETLLDEIDRLKEANKHDLYRLAETERELSEWKHKKFARFNEEECWLFQDDGEDHLESLVCPVVMSRDKAIELVQARYKTAVMDTQEKIKPLAAAEFRARPCLVTNHSVYQGDLVTAEEVNRTLTTLVDAINQRLCSGDSPVRVSGEIRFQPKKDVNKCPRCGGGIAWNTSQILTSDPPQYQGQCILCSRQVSAPCTEVRGG